MEESVILESNFANLIISLKRRTRTTIMALLKFKGIVIELILIKSLQNGII